MKTIYIVRHGETEWNAERRMQGRLDSPLNDNGREQAYRHGRTLVELGGVDFIVASPSGRTRETTAIINRFLGVPVEYDERLMERDCGNWSGFTVDEIAAMDPGEWWLRDRDPYFHRPPGGENLPDVIDRVVTPLQRVLAAPEPRVAVITHGIVSRAILTHLLELTPVQANRLRHPNNLFYRLTLGTDGLTTDFFRDGSGPVSGLLRPDADETIPVAGMTSD
ncbi:MAG: histidine phosphatase family protein [Pseudomonadales bacterium]